MTSGSFDTRLMPNPQKVKAMAVKITPIMTEKLIDCAVPFTACSMSFAPIERETMAVVAIEVDMMKTMQMNNSCSETPTAACGPEPSILDTYTSANPIKELQIVVSINGHDMIQIARHRLPCTSTAS